MRLSQLHPNEGQIRGVPNNPRKISDEEFQKLKKSIFGSREFLIARPIVVDEEWNILGGNMRWRACCALRDEKAKNKDFTFTDEIPDEWVKQVRWPIKKKREFVLKDNESNGETDKELLTAWDAVELADWGLEVENIAPVVEQEDLFLDADQEEGEQKQEPSYMQFETAKQKRKALWGIGHVSEARTDLKEIITAHVQTTHDGISGYLTIYNKTKEGILLTDIKSEEHKEYVEVFAQSAWKTLMVAATIRDPKTWCIITTPKRRHKGYHFATEVCKRLSELTGVRFEDEVLTATGRDRISPKFTKEKEPPEPNYILYDDIVTTGMTLKATKALFPDKNFLTIVNVCNQNAKY